jgi:hypothetical protein
VFTVAERTTRDELGANACPMRCGDGCTVSLRAPIRHAEANSAARKGMKKQLWTYLTADFK